MTAHSARNMIPTVRRARQHVYARELSESSMSSVASCKMNRTTRQRTYMREESESSMSSTATSTTMSSSTLSSSSTHSTNSLSSPRLDFSNTVVVGTRKRTDTDSSLEVDLAAAVRPKRRSHRPRGCRGGRKNRKKNQQDRHQVPGEIGGGKFDSSAASAKTYEGQERKKSYPSKPTPATKTQQPQPLPPQPKTMASLDSDPVLPPPVPQSQSSLSAISSLQSLSTSSNVQQNIYRAKSSFTNPTQDSGTTSSTELQHQGKSQYAVPPANHKLTGVSSVSNQHRHSQYLSSTNLAEAPPTFDLTYSSSSDSNSSSNFELEHKPNEPSLVATGLTAGLTSTSSEILPPPPPPGSKSGRKMIMKGPNPYSLTKANRKTQYCPDASLDNRMTITQPATFQNKTKAMGAGVEPQRPRYSIYDGANDIPPRPVNCYNATADLNLPAFFAMKDHRENKLGETTNNAFDNAAVTPKKPSVAVSSQRSAASTTTTSLFVISPRSFLTGSKGRPPAVAVNAW